MASVIMAALFIGGTTVSSSPVIPPRRLVITNSMKTSCQNQGEKSSNGRREVLFAAITATVCSVSAGIALADDKKPPKRGSPEAKKAYGPVCVANPTARICNN
ncbi:photosystem II 5 kDa protein, chloroplastic-like [Silene latifolia]|uniref:photosystem II 5 kDa protein, chloroplastic-like n=1 Tax=Silene latifolia TaxID=37657 RepID=UPI003D76D646